MVARYWHHFSDHCIVFNRIYALVSLYCKLQPRSQLEAFFWTSLLSVQTIRTILVNETRPLLDSFCCSNGHIEPQGLVQRAVQRLFGDHVRLAESLTRPPINCELSDACSHNTAAALMNRKL